MEELSLTKLEARILYINLGFALLDTELGSFAALNRSKLKSVFDEYEAFLQDMVKKINAPEGTGPQELDNLLISEPVFVGYINEKISVNLYIKTMAPEVFMSLKTKGDVLEALLGKVIQLQ